MNVLIIPEDFRKDQYMLKPIIQSMLAYLERSKAKVRVCQDPLLGGCGEALKWENINRIISRYRMVDLFVLCVDRDGKDNRHLQLRALEKQSQMLLTDSTRVFLAENAWQEIEVWVLAGVEDLPKSWSWRKIRAEQDPKEHYYEPFARQRGVLEAPDQGRQLLSVESARNYARIRQLCPEDIQSIERRIQSWINTRA